jgi:hypothetical protein
MFDGIENELIRDTDGIWHIKQAGQPVSYPREGHDLLFEIEDDSWWFQHRNRVIGAILKRFPPTGTVWDIGGGNGVVSGFLNDIGFPCVFLDSGVEGCRHARNRGVETVICSGLEDLRFRPGMLPGVLLFDVLEHCDRPERMLKILYDALRGDGTGMIYITVPAHPWLWSPEDEWAGHFTRYSVNELLKLLRKTGFSIRYHTFFFTCLSLFIALFRVLPSRLKLPFRKEQDGPSRCRAALDKPMWGLARPLINWHLDQELKGIVRGHFLHGSSILVVGVK